MLIMDPREHALILSPDERILAIYSAAIRDIMGITHSSVFIDPDLASTTTGETVQSRERKQAIRGDISRIKQIAKPLGIQHLNTNLASADIDSVTASILAIHDTHPAARYSFVIPGGPVPVALAFFRMAIWLDGDAYYVTQKTVLKKLTVPQVTTDEFAANPNYLKLLTLLHGKPQIRDGIPTGVPRQVLFEKMKDEYVPIRSHGEKGRRHALTHGNFSQFLATLVEQGLVAEFFSETGKKIRLYNITPDGELVFRLFSKRAH